MSSGKVWSQEVLNIFHTFQTTNTNISISACPGSGKTTVLEALWSMTPYQSTLSLAFNKAIADEASIRMPYKPDSAIKTFNGFGHGVCMNNGGIFDKNKLYTLIKTICSKMPKQIKSGKRTLSTQPIVVDLVRHMQCFDNFIRTPYEVEDVKKQFNIDNFPHLIDYAIEVYDAALMKQDTFDFNDQVLHPVYHDYEIPQYDLILIDEAQDLNPIQIAFLGKLKGRKIFVGDPHQSIYGFRGSVNNAMHVLTKAFNAKAMPMTLTYRCPYQVVKEAQHYYPDDIQALSQAKEGTVDSQYIEDISPQESDLILCRVNAPLVSMYFDLLKKGIPSFIQGRNYGESLLNYVKSFDTKSIDELFTFMESDLQSQPEEKKGFYRERLDVFYAVYYNLIHPTVENFILELQTLFNPNDGGICLSSIHRAKGLEAGRVYLLKRELYERFKNHPLASEESCIQEDNLMYVAITRAKDQFTYIIEKD